MEVKYNITEEDYVKSSKLNAAATRKQLLWWDLLVLDYFFSGFAGLTE